MATRVRMVGEYPDDEALTSGIDAIHHANGLYWDRGVPAYRG
jgi:hypothetical protein